MEIYDVKKMTERLNSKVLKERYIAKIDSNQGCIKLSILPRVGGGIKSKGRKSKHGKEEKMF